MEKKKVLALLVSSLLIVGMIPTQWIFASETVDMSKYEYFEYTAPDSAFVNLYGDLESRNASFIDGISMGVKDIKDPYYYESVNIDGLEGRKQYNANSTYIKVDKSFFGEKDTYFLVSIVYYDFGPSEGSYYLEYTTTGGEMKQEKLVKPGRHPGWAVKTVVLPDVDLNPHYENGATLRIQNGAYNAFRKVEIVNISKHLRENTSSSITALGLEKVVDLEKVTILDYDDPMFAQNKLGKPCSIYDAKYFANRYAMNNESIAPADKNNTLTQGELLKMFMDVIGIKYDGQANLCAYAKSIGLIKGDSMFSSDSALATYYNLGSIVDDVLYYEDSEGISFLYRLFEKGFFNGVEPTKIQNEKFMALYYSQPRKNPYITITDNTTKRTFHYINFYGKDMWRPYLTSPSWLHDGKRFICSTASGYLYLYNIETQMMSYLGVGGSGTDGTVGIDGMVYVMGKQEDGCVTFNRIDPDDPELKRVKVYTFPKGVSGSTPNISKDGKYFSVDLNDSGKAYFNPPKDMFSVARFDIDSQSYEAGYYKFPKYNHILNHIQVNPIYPNLIFFAHETADNKGYTYSDVNDRVNIMDLDTGKVISYNQGEGAALASLELATHESWSVDGEYLFFCMWPSQNSDGLNSGISPGAVVRINKDGTHRQYYYDSKVNMHFNHCFPSADKKWVVADSSWVNLINTETSQVFPITQHDVIEGGKNHPYHAHAQIAAGHNLINWGHEHNGVLGVAWYDFTEIAENEIVQGGRYKVNDYVETVSYKTLECESEQVKKDDRDCQMAKAGKEIFYAINPDIVDTDNDSVKITFDYLDNSIDPIILSYTRGVRVRNDAFRMYNGEKTIKRKKTGRWKTATITIDSGNFESIGRYESDFKLKGGSANLYISNIKVEKVEK